MLPPCPHVFIYYGNGTHVDNKSADAAKHGTWCADCGSYRLTSKSEWMRPKLHKMLEDAFKKIKI